MAPQDQPRTDPYINPNAKSYTCEQPPNAREVLTYHKTLPTYAQTPLVPLPKGLFADHGIKQVYVKDESRRFSLPSFKILGASWAIHRTLCATLELPATTALASIRTKAQGAGLKFVSCTDGNWGRALAFTARMYGVAAAVYVPRNMDAATRARIAGEGAEVLVVQGDYNVSIQAAVDASRRTGALLVMDTSWPGYEEIPRWVTDGYESMLAEVDETLADSGDDGSCEGTQPDLVIVSVGVGSWAHSVVSHYKSQASPSRLVATVEATAAPSLLTSLHSKSITPIRTEDTIMCGMNCGTTSTIAWPLLRDGVDVALAISDWEAHEAVLELSAYGIKAGPCGAAPLAALRRILKLGLLGHGDERKLAKDATVVLFCTEGARPYDLPKNEALSLGGHSK